MSRIRITLDYCLNNEDWTEQEFEDNQDIERIFHITEQMLIDLIHQSIELSPGDYVHSIGSITKN
jgi:hypothetical protein